MNASGPIGKPVMYQITIIIVHPSKNTMVYGNIAEISVPIPVSSSYFCANVTITAKYDISGEIMFVVEDLLKTNWTLK